MASCQSTIVNIQSASTPDILSKVQRVPSLSNPEEEKQRKPLPYTVSATKKKLGMWSEKEHELFMETVKQYGKDYKRLRRVLPGRSSQ
jgi:hypothetical protein